MKELTGWWLPILIFIIVGVGIIGWIPCLCAFLIEKVCTRCSNDSEEEYCKTMREFFVSLVWVVVAFNFALISHHVAIKNHVFAHIYYIILIPNVWFAFALTRQKEWALLKRSVALFFSVATPIPVVCTNIKAFEMQSSLTKYCIVLGIGILTFTVLQLRERNSKAFHTKGNDAIRQTRWERMEPFLFWVFIISSILVCFISRTYLEHPEVRGTSNSVKVGKETQRGYNIPPEELKEIPPKKIPLKTEESMNIP